MRVYRSALLGVAAVAALTLAAGDAAFSQKVFSRSTSANVSAKTPARGVAPKFSARAPSRGVTPKFSANGPSRGGFPGGRNVGGGNYHRGYTGGNFAPGLPSLPPGAIQDLDGGNIDNGSPGANRGP